MHDSSTRKRMQQTAKQNARRILLSEEPSSRKSPPFEQLGERILNHLLTDSNPEDLIPGTKVNRQRLETFLLFLEKKKRESSKRPIIDRLHQHLQNASDPETGDYDAEKINAFIAFISKRMPGHPDSPTRAAGREGNRPELSAPQQENAPLSTLKASLDGLQQQLDAIKQQLNAAPEPGQNESEPARRPPKPSAQGKDREEAQNWFSDLFEEI